MVDPYSLVAKGGIWYMVGSVTRWMLVFRVSRVQASAITESHFERQSGFDLVAYWTDWCAQMAVSHLAYPVTLRVVWEAIPLLPGILGERAHSLLEQASPPGSEGAITLNLTFESLEAARSQVLGLGPLVEVLEPAELRDSLIEPATKIVALYARKAAAMRSEPNVSG